MSDIFNFSLEEQDFIPEQFEKDEAPATFVLKPLSGRDALRIKSGYKFSDDGMMSISSSVLEHAIQKGLVDWKNVCNDGREIPFKKNKVFELPGSLLQQIAMKIIEISDIQEEEEKN